MPGEDIVLKEADRSKLDGIVQKMIANKESDDNIKFVVSDFKAKYGVKKKEATTAPSLSNSPLASANMELSSEGGESVPSGGGINYLEGGNFETLQAATPPQAPQQPSSTLLAATTPLEVAKDQINYDQKIQEELKTNYYAEALMRGSAHLANSVLKTPAFLYDVASAVTNKVINEPINAVTGGALGYMPSSADIAQKLPADNPTAAVDQAVEHSENAKRQIFDKEINQYFADGEWGKGFDALAVAVLETAPTTIALMMGNAAGLTTRQAVFGGGAVFGADKMSQIEKDPEGKKLSPMQQVSNAAATGLFEGAFEQWGLTKLGLAAKEIFVKAGLPAAKKVAEEGFKNVYAPLLKKYLGIGAEEVASEVATQFAENVVDKYGGYKPDLDLGTGLKDAALIALGSSGAMTTPVAAIDVMVTKANRKKAQDLADKKAKLEEDLLDEDVNDATKAVLVKKIRDINELEADLEKAERETLSNLTPESKQKINLLQEKANEMAGAAIDINIQEDTKAMLQKDLDGIDNEIDKVIEEDKVLQKQLEEKAKQEEIDAKDELEYLKSVEETIGLDEDEFTRMMDLQKQFPEETLSPVSEEAAPDQTPAGGTQEGAVPAQGGVQETNISPTAEIEKKIKENKDAWFDEKIDYVTYRKNQDDLRRQLEEIVQAPEEAPVVEQPVETTTASVPSGAQQVEQVTQQNIDNGKGDQAAAGNRLFNEPIQKIKDITEKYFERVFGKKRPRFVGTKKFDRPRAKKIAEAYKAMKHDPENPEVQKAYAALAKETVDQWNDLSAELGIEIEVDDKEPYRNSAEMLDDVKKNNRVKILSTESGFGEGAITEKQRKENPLLADSGIKDKNGVPLLFNDVFRAVHDLIGHGELGNSFGPKGEENAWNVHARLYSPEARRAMTTETRGQNSFVNFSGVNDKVEGLVDQARKLRKEGKEEEAQKIVDQIQKELSYAEQKIGLLPEEFTEFDENDIGDEDRLSEEERLEYESPKPTTNGQKTEGDQKPQTQEAGVLTPEKQVTSKAESPVTESEEGQQEDPEALKRLETDIEAIKQMSKKDIVEKKFLAMVERAFKMKAEKKISRPTYTKFKHKAQDILGGKHNLDAEELKMKSTELINKIKNKLLGEGYKKVTLSTIVPITPKTVSDLLDLANALIHRGIDAGFSIAEATKKAMDAIKKHPVYKKLVASGELKEQEFNAAVSAAAVKPKKKKKPAPKKDQPGDITGEVRKKKTVERQETSKTFKDVVDEMGQDEKFYHSIKESAVEPHIQGILDEVQNNGGLEDLAKEIIDGNNPFHDKIANVAAFFVGERLALIAEKEGNLMQKSAMNKLAAKLMVERNKSVNISATQTAMENIIAKRLPISVAGLTAYTSAAVSQIQNSALTPTQQGQVKQAVMDINELLETEEAKKKIREAVEEEVNKIAENSKGKEWVDKLSKAMSGLKIDLKDC